MKYILFALLFVASASAAALPYWTVVGNSGDVTVYANVDTIPNHGKIVTMWFLGDFATPKGKGKVLSTLIQQKYDCDKELQKTLQIEVFTEHMGRGVGKYLSLPHKLTEWHRIVLDSDEETFWRVACNL